MGFTEDTVERAIIIGGARTIEDCVHLLVPNGQEVMEHKYVPFKQLYPHEGSHGYYYLCAKNRKK